MLGYCLISAVEMKSEVGKARFLASLRNDSGGGSVGLALSGRVRFLASLRNDSGDGGYGIGPIGNGEISRFASK